MSATSRAAEATAPQPGVPTLAVCALRLRQPMESDRIIQPFSSWDFTLLLMVGKLRKPSWPLPVRFSPSAMLLLPAPADLSRPPTWATGRYQCGAVGSAQSQHCGLVAGARWGSFIPNFAPRSHLAPGRLTPDGEGPCTGGLRHGWGTAGGVGSGANRKLCKKIWVFPSGRGPRKTLACAAPGWGKWG